MFYIILHDTVKGVQVACMADHYEVWADGYLASYESHSKLLPSTRYQFKKVVAKTDIPKTRTFYPFEL